MGSTIVFGLLAAILGVVILVWPGPTFIVAAVLFGVYLVTSGVALVLLAFTLPVAGGSHRILSFVSGAASIILGVLAFRHFDEGYAFLLLAIWISIGFIFRGVAAGGAALGEPGTPGRGWAILFSLISVIAGVVVLAYPFDSIVTLTFVVGIWLIVLGVAEVVFGLGILSDAKKLAKVAHSATDPVPA